MMSEIRIHQWPEDAVWMPLGHMNNQFWILYFISAPQSLNIWAIYQFNQVINCQLNIKINDKWPELKALPSHCCFVNNNTDMQPCWCNVTLMNKGLSLLNRHSVRRSILAARTINKIDWSTHYQESNYYYNVFKNIPSPSSSELYPSKNTKLFKVTGRGFSYNWISARSGLQMHPNCRLLPAYFPVNNTERAEHKQQQPVPEYTLLTRSRALTQSAWFAI